MRRSRLFFQLNEQYALINDAPDPTMKINESLATIVLNFSFGDSFRQASFVEGNIYYEDH